MRYRKFRADKLFTGTQLLSDEHVLITDSKGKIEAIVPVAEAGDDVQTFTGWLTPGFVNSHCHLELSHMKGLIPEKTGLVDFVFSVVTQRHFPEDEILDAIARAEAEMITNGIVAVGDICNNLLTLPQKQLQNLHYYNFVEASGWLPSVASQRVARSKSYMDAFSEAFPASLVPHAPYSVSHDLWQLIQPHFRGKVASIHNQETAFEDELFLSNTGDFLRMYQQMNIDHSFYQPSGKTSLQSYFHHLAPASSTILVHNTFTREEDVLFVKKAENQVQSIFPPYSYHPATINQQPGTRNQQPGTRNQKPETPNKKPLSQTSFCLCINANQYIESALPPIELLRKHNAGIILGTDSLASNWSLSIWDEIKTIQIHFPAIPLEEILQWATFNGARALELESHVGSFAKGKTPGVVVIENLERIKRLV